MISRRNSRHTIEIRNDIVELTSMYSPDMSWVYKDKMGHTHRWTKTGPANFDVTSCKYKKVTMYDSDIDAEYDSYVRVCKYCGEEITPRYSPNIYREFIVGMQHFYVDGVETTKEEAEKAISENRAII